MLESCMQRCTHEVIPSHHYPCSCIKGFTFLGSESSAEVVYREQYFHHLSFNKSFYSLFVKSDAMDNNGLITAAMPLQAITQQPKSYVEYFDKVSTNLYHGLQAKHNTGTALQGKIEAYGQNLLQEVRRPNQEQHEMGNMEFLQGLLCEGETLVSVEPHLQYDSFVITDEEGSQKDARGKGSAILTNQRLVLLASEHVEGAEVQEFGDAKVLPGGYEIKLSLHSVMYYLPISLQFFRSVEINGKSGNEGSTRITGDCNCQCCWCPKTWTPSPLVVIKSRTMTVKFGLLMPPWGHRSFLVLNVEPEAPSYYVRDFVSLVQKTATSII